LYSVGGMGEKTLCSDDEFAEKSPGNS